MRTGNLRRRRAPQTPVCLDRRVHRRVAEATAIRQALLEVSAPNHHCSQPRDRPARRGEARDVGRWVERVFAPAVAELLPVERQLDQHVVLAHQCVRLNRHRAQQVLVYLSARPRANAKAPASRWLPAMHRQIVYPQLPVKHDAQPARAHRHLHRCHT
eukprot:7391673-Prymnesium_polylepis.2